MRTVPLGDLGEIVSGSTPKTNEADYWNGEIPWVTPADLSEHEGIYFRGKPKTITKAGFESCSAPILPPGSILFSSRAPIGHCAVTVSPVCTNQGFKNIVPNKRLDPIYGFFALKFVTPIIIARGRGATFNEVTKDIMENVPIPYCDLPEQQRIAGLLEQADRIRRARRYALELSGTFLPSAFLELFGDPKRNPKGWPDSYLSDLCLKFSDGPFGSNLKTSHYTPSGVRVIRLQNIGVGEFLNEDQAFVSEDHFQVLRKHECRPGDVLIGTLGDPNLRACIQPAEVPIALNKADCIQARPDPQKTDRYYLCWLLNTPTTLHLAPGLVHGQTRSRVSMGQLADLPVPVPPVPLQRRFAMLVEGHERLQAGQREGLRLADHLFQSLLHRAFSGDHEVAASFDESCPA